MTTISSKKFKKASKKLSKEMKSALKERLKMFVENPFHPILNNHALQGSMRHYRSINITGDYRVIYEKIGDNLSRLMDVDTHSNLYR